MQNAFESNPLMVTEERKANYLIIMPKLGIEMAVTRKLDLI